MVSVRDVTDDVRACGCEAVFEVTDPSGLQAWIAVHDSSPGRAVGGIRRRRYSSAEAAIEDATSLAGQMTVKTRFAGLPAGGGKSVILHVPGVDWEAAYAALGQAVTRLEGRYFCGPDVGTGERELAWLRQTTRFVNSPENDASEATARGVLAGISACNRFVGLKTPTTVIQGLGRVGSRVARGLVGSALTVADVNPDALVGFTNVVAPEVAVTTPCELFSPCAVGPVVTADNVHRLQCRVICGSANTQLADVALAETLAGRGILYAPDFVVNAGAVIEGVTVLFEGGDGARERSHAVIDGIEERLFAVFEEARRTGQTPLSVALEWAQ